MTRVSSTLDLVPVLALPIAWLWMGEVPDEFSPIGGGIAPIGVLLVRVK